MEQVRRNQVMIKLRYAEESWVTDYGVLSAVQCSGIGVVSTSYSIYHI